MKIRIRTLASAALFALLIGTLALTGCGEPTEAEKPAAEQPAAEQTETATPEGDQLYTPEYKPNGKETAVITTTKGEITVELYGTDAPIHVGNFVELVRKGFYDGTKFHRYEPGFVVQGGDPLTKDATSEQVASAAGQPGSGFGTGGPGYQIRGEFDLERNPNKHVEGALGMARSQSADSAGSQFYFTLAEAAFLDGQYTVFGKVTKGLDIVKSLRVGDAIEKVELIGATE